MRTTKKIISAVLAICMLASTSIMSSFAATADNAVSGSDNALDNKYTQAAEAIDAEYAYDGTDLGATYSPEGTVFKVWSPKASEVTLNLYATGSDTEEGAADLGSYTLEKFMDGDKWTGVWTTTVSGDLKNVYYTYTVATSNTTETAATK